MSLVEQELLTLPDHLSSPPVYSGIRVTQSLVLYVCVVDRCLSFCTFSFGHCVVCSSSFGHCVVCSSSIYGFWLPLWYLQTLLSCDYGKCQIQEGTTTVPMFILSSLPMYYHSSLWVWFPHWARYILDTT